MPGSVLETVVTPAKLGYLAYRSVTLSPAEKHRLGTWLAHAGAVCRTANTCFLCDVMRLSAFFLAGDRDDEAVTDFGFALPPRHSGALDDDLPSDAAAARTALIDGDLRDDVLSLVTHRVCRAELRRRFTLRQTAAHGCDATSADRLRQLLSRFATDVTFTAHGDRYLHMYVQAICASWSSTVTRSREPAFKAAEAQYQSALNDKLRPLIGTPPAQQLEELAEVETARCFSLVAGLLLELVPSASVAVDHEVLWARPEVPTLFWLSDFGVPDCYGVSFGNQLHCFNGRGVLCAAAEWLFMTAAVDGEGPSLSAALYVYRPSVVPASSPISKYL